MDCELRVSLTCNTPVVGCEINPIVRFSPLNLPPYSLTFCWYREQIACSIHDTRSATVQCTSCIKLKIPGKHSYYCSANCFLDGWPKHLELHYQAGNSESRNGDQRGPKLHRSSGSWIDYDCISLLDNSAEVENQEGNHWVKVGSSKAYVPSVSDAGFCLRLTAMIVDSLTGSSLSPMCILVSDPVINFPTHAPRKMIQIRSGPKIFETYPSTLPSHDVAFSVLSYNILSDLYANTAMHSHCPPWALAWEYRKQNLLQEILECDADILCLQEVQSDHFESFFKPELIKCGYSVLYKKRTKEVYTANQYTTDGCTTDGCATFYRRALFKEIVKYEVEFDKMALSLVEALDPKVKAEGRIRLMKGNVALVVILEALNSGNISGALRSRICLANTHVHANPELPDVKLCQITQLIHGLEKICESQIPLVICGDLNIIPKSSPHQFLVRGCTRKKKNDPLHIYPLLKLHHSLTLVSAYESFTGSEEVGKKCLTKVNLMTKKSRFTCFKPGSSLMLDYILYTVGSLTVEGLLDLLDLNSVGTGLPSPHWSSDHIALMARFRLSPPSACNLYTPPPLPSNPWG